MATENLPMAETLNYWKTGKSSAKSWLDKTEALIEQFGGEVSVVAKGKEGGQIAYLIDFTFPPDRFRLIWPVLPTRGGDIAAAERQAATMLHHDVKARAMRVAVMGVRAAFIDALLLDSGQTVSQTASVQLQSALPQALLPPGG